METILCGRELKETFTLDDWIAQLDDDDIVRVVSDSTPGGEMRFITEYDEYTL